MADQRILTVLFLLLTSRLVYAADWHASPTGSPTGAGTQAAPWDLATALKHPSIQPGDTLYLRGGTYHGKFVGKLQGATVRSALGEWAIIDGAVTTMLSQTIDATTRVVTLANGGTWPNGSDVLIDGEHIHLNNLVNGVYTACSRGWNGTTPASHTAGTVAYLGGDVFTVTGADSTYRDFEVMHSGQARTWPVKSTFAPELRGDALQVNAARVKLINLVLHDGQNGLFAGQQYPDVEVYGCLLFNNGYLAGGGQYGHGVYGANASATGRKQIEECFAFNNFDSGFKLVSQSANAIGIDLAGCIAWGNGSPKGPGPSNPGIILGANNGVADDVSVRECFLWQPNNSGGNNLRLGYSGQNGKVVVADSVFSSGYPQLDVTFWQNLTVTGNRCVIPGIGGRFVSMGRVPGGAETWDNNQYWNAGGLSEALWGVKGGISTSPWATWRAATGFDAASTFTGSVPSSPWVFVRPNRYEPGRANLIVYNWPGTPTVSVDLSAAGLADGQRFEIRNVQNWPAAVLAGTYNAAAPTVSLPMTGSVVAPIGNSVTPPGTGPQFGAFVLLPAGPPLPPQDPSLAAAEAALQSWLGLYGGRVNSDPAWARFQGVAAELRKAR